MDFSYHISVKAENATAEVQIVLGDREVRILILKRARQLLEEVHHSFCLLGLSQWYITNLHRSLKILFSIKYNMMEAWRCYSVWRLLLERTTAFYWALKKLTFPSPYMFIGQATYVIDSSPGKKRRVILWIKRTQHPHRWDHTTYNYKHFCACTCYISDITFLLRTSTTTSMNTGQATTSTYTGHDISDMDLVSN